MDALPLSVAGMLLKNQEKDKITKNSLWPFFVP